VVTVDNFTDFLNSNSTKTLQYFRIDPVKPERVHMAEVGYRATLFKKVYVDASYYFSLYQNFIGYKICIDPDLQLNIFDPTNAFPTTKTQAYRFATNSKDLVTTQGASVQISYFFAKFFTFSGNYTWNVLDRRGSTDPLIPAFNTPQHKFNVGFDARDIQWTIGKKFKLNNWGFGVNFKWIQGFRFEGSPQFTGDVPSYYMLDAQLTYNYKKAHTSFKLGAQNITDNRVYQVYGGPQIGRLAYFSVVFDWNFKKDKK
jgi:outer membrane receptor protein involved in Fe transport